MPLYFQIVCQTLQNNIRLQFLGTTKKKSCPIASFSSLKLLAPQHLRSFKPLTMRPATHWTKVRRQKLQNSMLQPWNMQTHKDSHTGQLQYGLQKATPAHQKEHVTSPKAISTHALIDNAHAYVYLHTYLQG